MANYCSNTVRFIGNEDDVAAVRKLFEDIQQKQNRSNRYHMPDFVSAASGYMEDIEASNDWINYETRWVPNMDVLVQIAERYQLEFIAAYYEPMEGHYGEAIYTGGDLHLAHLNLHLENKNEHLGLLHIHDMQQSLLGGPLPER